MATTLDDSGSSIPVPVTWEVTNGTIDDQGRFDAGPAGTTTVTACYGVICDAMTFVVTPGAPVTLMVTTDDSSITSDATLAVEASVVDADGNVVPGQSLRLRGHQRPTHRLHLPSCGHWELDHHGPMERTVPITSQPR